MSEVVYLRPTQNISVDFKEKRSLFIGHVRLVCSEEEARTMLKTLVEQYKDASHNCWAYRIDFPSYREYYSDAGEPSGTAGKPISGSIARKGVTDVLVVVTRYFGGIKLGVRGLIDAYGRAASLALDASGSHLYIPSELVHLVIPYDAIRSVIYSLKSLGIDEKDASISYLDVVEILAPVSLKLKDQASDLFTGLAHKEQILRWNWQH